MMRVGALCLALVPAQAMADFTESNLLAIFYHELGHAVIHQMDVPIFGQEEDAADALSILLIDALYEAEAQNEPAFWDTHGPDEQRYFNTVCLFYGADPDGREEFAQDLELPEERAEGCEDEFALAADSWHSVLDGMSAKSGLTGQLVLNGSVAMELISHEIKALNAEFKWPRDITVTLESCDEANAFYDLDAQSITMCTELVDWLYGIATQIAVD
jgi:hypothetical protein